MATTCVLLANGFEEIEAVTIVDVLRRAQVEVTTVGVEGRNVMGSHNIPIVADAELVTAAEQEWDGVVLPGGLPGANTLRDNENVQALLRDQHTKGRMIGAICAAPIALARAGILRNKWATCYPGFETDLYGAKATEERVVQDGRIVTSRGVGTALEFSLALVRLLVGEQKASQLRTQMLV